MSRDLTIRLLGRPQVSTDKTTGFRKLVRKYVVEGPRASKAGIEDSTNPLFLASGASDEEFDNYYLTNQALAPANGTLDKAYLHREFIELRSTAISEQYVQSNDLIRVRKRFAVLRNDDANLGYGAAWGNHPSNASIYAKDPWEYAPSWVANATPGSRNYNVSNADTDHGFDETPQLDGVNLGSKVSLFASSGDWLKGYAVMSQAGSGLDVWQVEWVTHAAPYWRLGTASGNRRVNSSVRVLSVDQSGVFEKDSLSSAGSVNYATRAMSYVFFVKGSSIPTDLAKIGGGSGGVSFSPVVRSNFSYTTWDPESGRSTVDVREVSKGCVWDGEPTLNLTLGDGSSVKIADEGQGNSLVFDWDAAKNFTPDSIVTQSGQTIYPPNEVGENDRAIFRGKYIESIHGKISWTMHKDSYSWSSSSGTFDRTSTQITPIFSHGSEKIWRVAITYVGG